MLEKVITYRSQLERIAKEASSMKAGTLQPKSVTPRIEILTESAVRAAALFIITTQRRIRLAHRRVWW